MSPRDVLFQEQRQCLALSTEHDSIGERMVPASAYYGVHTMRALENSRHGTSIQSTPISRRASA